MAKSDKKVDKMHIPTGPASPSENVQLIATLHLEAGNTQAPLKAQPLPNDGQLTLEISTFNELRTALLEKHPNEYAVISGSELAGCYPTYDRALMEGYDKFGEADFLVQQILKTDPEFYVGAVVMAGQIAA